METLFVGNLSYFCTESVLRNTFQPFGTVNSAIIRKTKANQTLFYGFVQMASAQEALAAVANLDGKMIQGRRMKVSISKSTQEKDTCSDHFIQTRVSFLTHHTRQQVNEALLHRIFSRFGEVADCVVKQYEITQHPRAKQCGYAYLYFFDIASAKRAISSLSGERKEEIESIRMDCKLSLESAQKLQDILSLDEHTSAAASRSASPVTSAATSLSTSSHMPIAKTLSPIITTSASFEDTRMSESDLSTLSSPTSMQTTEMHVNSSSSYSMAPQQPHHQLQQQAPYYHPVAPVPPPMLMQQMMMPNVHAPPSAVYHNQMQQPIMMPPPAAHMMHMHNQQQSHKSTSPVMLPAPQQHMMHMLPVNMNTMHMVPPPNMHVLPPMHLPQPQPQQMQHQQFMLPPPVMNALPRMNHPNDNINVTHQMMRQPQHQPQHQQQYFAAFPHNHNMMTVPPMRQ